MPSKSEVWKIKKAQTLRGYAQEYLLHEDKIYHDARLIYAIMDGAVDSKVDSELADTLNRYQQALTYRDDGDIEQLNPQIENFQTGDITETLIFNGITRILRKTHRKPSDFDDIETLRRLVEQTRDSIAPETPLVPAPITIHGALAMLNYILES